MSIATNKYFRRITESVFSQKDGSYLVDNVIIDNLGSHKGKEVRKAIRAVGARLVFLPKYSPDLNPIEQVFAKFKTLLQRPKREATRRSPTQALKSSPSIRPPNAPHTSRMQDTGKAKCRRL